MKQKISVIVLLLAVVMLCGGVFLFRFEAPAVLENDKRAHEETVEGELVIVEGMVPLSEEPTDTVEASEETEEDPFKDFTEDEVKMINEVFEKVNAERVAAGLPELNLNPELCKAAMVRAGECVKVFSHTRPDGTKYSSAIREAGIEAGYSAENVATGHSSAAQVMKGWMKSAGHKKNILRDYYTDIGIGMVKNSGNGYGGYSWCQLFIKVEN